MSRVRHYGALLLSAIGLVGLVATVPGGAGAAPESASFDTPGTYDWVVPDGVTSVTVDAYGAAGGDGQVPEEPSPGGLGGRTRATIEVTPGETLQVNVGGLGGSYTGGGPAVGGANGGGDAGGLGAGAGGGASDLRQGGTALDDRVVAAGGGGGGGARIGVCQIAAGGAGGGDVPTAGESISDTVGGQPGAADAGGAGGAGSGMGGPGASGSAGTGGAGGTVMMGYAAGGGGGGWYGGGGGGAGNYSSAGGGGSGHVIDGATSVTRENGSRAGDGLVVLSWEPAAPTTTTTTAAPSTTTTTVAAGPVATYRSGATELTLAAGESLGIASSGWQAGGTVTVTLHSDPVVLGTVVADATGSFESTFAVPAATPVGAHTVVLSGPGTSGGAASVELLLEVTAAGPAPAASLSFAC